MANPQDKASKADVQSTELNKMPLAEEEDTEFSAEEAAEVFEENSSDPSRHQD
ncbi:hypothetical protein ACFOLF_17005 [Paenibacillus sepulcri]|uniref:YfhD family protein n=1 Tax=Paenibacillus sepulcri TaxID=359917 RepID=A0ABS7CFT2_9BACL|nr:hypothetical protein [Paenibacillus sepulcri]